MTKYKLKHKLPFAKAGTEWRINDREPGAEEFLLFDINETTDKVYLTWPESWGDPRDSDWFEEVKPEPTYWIPTNEEVFWVVTWDGLVNKQKPIAPRGWYDSVFHMRNYFRTEAQAEAARDKIKALLSEIHEEQL